jgi:hypothetical protein
MEADDLLCSRNARTRSPLVERAHVGSPPGRASQTHRLANDESVECPSFFVWLTLTPEDSNIDTASRLYSAENFRRCFIAPLLARYEP